MTKTITTYTREQALQYSILVKERHSYRSYTILCTYQCHVLPTPGRAAGGDL